MSPIPMKGRTAEHTALKWIHVDPLGQGDEKLVLMWEHPPTDKWGVERSYILTRMSARGGELHEIGRFKQKTPVSDPYVSTPEGIFWPGENGVARFHKGQVEYFGAEHGAPDERATSVAWLDKTLYLAYPSALVAFDLGEKKFTTLASSKIVEPRHALDGGVGYQVGPIFADADNQCVWMAIYTDYDRAGLWQYMPARNEFRRVVSNVLPFRMSRNPAGEFHFVLIKQFFHVDPRTQQQRLLKGYAPFWNEARSGWQQAIPYVVVDQRVFALDSVMYTPDAQEHLWEAMKWKWSMVEHYGKGFIAGESRTGREKIWLIEPRAKPAPAAQGSAN